MEYDSGENFTSPDYEYTSTNPTLYVFHDITFVLLAVAAISANVAIIYVIARFQRIRTIENIFLANWAIADTCSLLVTPTGYAVLDFMDTLLVNYARLRCSIYHIASTMQATTVLFMIIILVDWFFNTFFEHISQKLRTFYKYIIGCIWIIALMICGVTSGSCLNHSFSIFSAITLLVSFCILLAAVVILQCTRGVRKCLNKPIEGSTLMLTLATGFVSGWLLAFLIFIVCEAANLHPIVAIIAEGFVFGNSMIILGLLYRLNTDFQACLLQVLKRSGKYEDSIYSFDNPIVRNLNNKDSIQISFDNPKDELLTNVY